MKVSEETGISLFLLDHPIQDVPIAVKPKAAKRCEAGFTAMETSCSLWQAERREQLESGIILQKQCPET